MSGHSIPITAEEVSPRPLPHASRQSNEQMSIANGARDGIRHSAGAQVTFDSTTGYNLGRGASACFRPTRKNLFRWGIFAVFSVSVGIAALMVSNRKSTEKVDPILAYEKRFINFRTILDKYSEPWAFALPTLPQTKSLEWLVFQDTTLSTNPDEKSLLQRHALITLFYACNGDNWKGNFALRPLWIEQVGTHECDFAGITCDEMGSIIELDGAGSQMSGRLPDELSFLTYLTSLRLHSNDLRGKLPMSIFTRLTNLGECNIRSQTFVMPRQSLLFSQIVLFAT